MSTPINRPRAPLAYTIGLAVAAAATTWFTLLSWQAFAVDTAKVTVPLLFIGAYIAGIGGVVRWLRLPIVLALVVQIVVGAMCVLGSITGSFVPTRSTIRDYLTAFENAIESAQTYLAPIPPDVAPITVILLTGGVAAFVVIDFLAGALRLIPLAGLGLLAVYSVPVSITGNGVSWLGFVAISIGFLVMLYLVQSEQITRWGHGLGSRTGQEADDPTAFGVRTGAIRRSAVAIGTTATTLALALPILVPTLDVTLFEGSGPGKRQIEVEDPMVDLRRDLSRGEDIGLMLVTSPDKVPSYLRLAVLTNFNGETWTPGNREIPPTQVARGPMPPLVGVAAGTPREESEYQVLVSDEFESTWVPTTQHVSQISLIGDWRYDTSTMDFMSIDDDVTVAGLGYSFTGVEVTPDPALMDNALSGASSVRSSYLDVPATISDEIRGLAAEITEDEPTRFRRARALQQWFREDGGFAYSTENIDDAEQGDLDSFLDESGRVGYCEQFAASMAIMARVIGIPARVAVGFLEPEEAGANQYEFSAHDLHAWPELFFPGAGWVRFEPTPAARADTVPSYTSADLAPVASNSPSPSATTSSDPSPTRSNRAEDTLTSTSDDSSFPWLVLVLVTLGVLLIAAVALLPAFVRRQRRERRLLGDIEDLWLELRDHAVDLGHGWPSGRSPRATGAWLAGWFGAADGDGDAERPHHGPEQDPDAVGALDRLVEQIERARYSRSAASVDQEQASHDLRTVCAALDRGVGPRLRRRAQWLPRSVRRSIRPSPSATADETTTRETISAG